MQANGVMDLDCPVTQCCVSLMTGIVSQVGIQLHVCSWNNHRTPGECVCVHLVDILSPMFSNAMHSLIFTVYIYTFIDLVTSSALLLFSILLVINVWICRFSSNISTAAYASKLALYHSILQFLFFEDVARTKSEESVMAMAYTNLTPQWEQVIKRCSITGCVRPQGA